MSRLQMVVTIGNAVLVATCVLVTALVWGMALNNFYVMGASGGSPPLSTVSGPHTTRPGSTFIPLTFLCAALGSLVTVVTCSSAAVRFTGNALMRWRFIFLFAFAGQINTFYLFILPRLITLQSQDALGGMGLTVVRLFVHPAIWTVVLFYFRIVQRHLGAYCTGTDERTEPKISWGVLLHVCSRRPFPLAPAPPPQAASRI